MIAKPTNHSPIGGAPDDILSPAVMYPVWKHIVTLPRMGAQKAEGIEQEFGVFSWCQSPHMFLA